MTRPGGARVTATADGGRRRGASGGPGGRPADLDRVRGTPRGPAPLGAQPFRRASAVHAARAARALGR